MRKWSRTLASSRRLQQLFKLMCLFDNPLSNVIALKLGQVSCEQPAIAVDVILMRTNKSVTGFSVHRPTPRRLEVVRLNFCFQSPAVGETAGAESSLGYSCGGGTIDENCFGGIDGATKNGPSVSIFGPSNMSTLGPLRNEPEVSQGIVSR